MHSISLTPLQKLWVKKITRDHLGSQGSKVHFHQKFYNSSMLHIITIRLIHAHWLEALYLCYGSKVNLGLFGVTGVKRQIKQKMHYLLYLTKNIHVIHTCALAWDPLPLFMGSKVNLGSTWGQESQNLIFTKMYYLLYDTQYIYVSYTRA